MLPPLNVKYLSLTFRVERIRGGECGRGMERARDGKGMEEENEKEGEMEMKGEWNLGRSLPHWR